MWRADTGGIHLSETITGPDGLTFADMGPASCRLVREQRDRVADDVGRRVADSFALLSRMASQVGLGTTAPATSIRHEADALEWYRVEVDGRTVVYGAGGTGPTVLFLHGWGLGSHAYKRALRRLVSRGCRVLAPALPGFGGSVAMPLPTMSIEGYGSWAKRFLDATGTVDPVVVIGHSFGGGVGATLAHAHPDAVRYLVLLNAVGGATWDGRKGASMAERPISDWARGFIGDLLPLDHGALATLGAISQDVVANLLRNPVVLWRAGELARTADLTLQLIDLQAHGIPVLALTSAGDHVIPTSAFDALCTSLGAEGQTVAGGHSWILADPDHFGEVMQNIVEAEVDLHRTASAAESGAAVRRLLETTTVPKRLVRRLVDDAPPLWLTSEAPPTLATDLALCHPKLRRGEVRAVASPIEDSTALRLSVVAEDRPGLLADTCAVLADHGIPVSSTSATTWPQLGLALHSLVVEPDEDDGPVDFDRLGERLRAMHDDPPTPAFVPVGRATVDVSGSPAQRATITVAAKDQTGLLWATCRWLADHDVSIEAVHATTEFGVARDTFIIHGECDHRALADALSKTTRLRLIA